MRYLAFFPMLVLVAIFHTSTHAAPLDKNNVAIVPFQLKGNSIIVKATINGLTGDFIVDTGAPELILNSSYFKGVAMNVRGVGVGMVDVSGEIQKMKQYSIESFTLGSLDLPGKYASVTDLKKIEEIKGGPLFGIIGYPVLKNFEIHFDFRLQELTIVPLAKKGIPVSRVALEKPTEVFELKFSNHIPYLTSYASGKKVRLGIDSGSEVNVMHEKFFHRSQLQIKDTHKIKIQGLSGSLTSAWRGSMTGLCLDRHLDGPMDMTLTSLTSVNQALPIHLHGFLGISYLKNVRFSINYKKKEMCIWTDQDGQIIDDLHAIELEAGIEPLEK